MRGTGLQTDLEADIVEHGNHAAHMGDGEDGVQQLALLAVVIAFRSSHRLTSNCARGFDIAHRVYRAAKARTGGG